MKMTKGEFVKKWLLPKLILEVRYTNKYNLVALRVYIVQYQYSFLCCLNPGALRLWGPMQLPSLPILKASPDLRTHVAKVCKYIIVYQPVKINHVSVKVTNIFIFVLS